MCKPFKTFPTKLEINYRKTCQFIQNLFEIMAIYAKPHQSTKHSNL